MTISLLLALGSIIGAVVSKLLGELLNSPLSFFCGQFCEVFGKDLQKTGFWRFGPCSFCFHDLTSIVPSLDCQEESPRLGREAYLFFCFLRFAHIACAALCAIWLLCSGVIVSILRLPPIFPPLR